MDRQRRRRAGFTLIEVLVVILIIGFLIALLVPAVLGAVRRAKEAQVAAEMNNLASALASFREKFGDYPPSRFYVSESGWYPATGANALVAQRSLEFLKKFWPRITLNTTQGAVGTSIGQFYDFNNNGIDDSGAGRDQYYILQGPECLVFFLGGMPTTTTNSTGTPQFGLVGFDRNPLNPFRTFVQTGAAATSPNRTVPLYEFVIGRLDDSEADPTYTGLSNGFSSGNGIPSYLDPLGSPASNTNFPDSDKRPYAYFYSYGANSFDPDDYNTLSEVDDNGTYGTFSRTFTTAFPPGRTKSQAPNPYTSSLPDPGNLPSTNNPITATYINSNSFQLISSGQDREWGIGGEFNKAAPNSPLPLTDGGTSNVSTGTTANPRQRENDNITNFSGGRLN